jgi:hypothetical protein
VTPESTVSILTFTKILCEFLFLTFLFLIFSKALVNTIYRDKTELSSNFALNVDEFTPFIIGPTITVMFFALFHSFGVENENIVLFLLSILMLISLVAIYRIIQNAKYFEPINQLKLSWTKSADFFGTLTLSTLFFLQTKGSILFDGYRTEGNNDPFDYLNLGRVFENSPDAFINFHQGWYEYSDRAGPWVTRFVSSIQFILPGGRFGDFSTFVFLTYFTLFLVSLRLLRSFHLQRSFALLLIYFIYTTSTMTYVFSQGFFLQTWGLIIILEFTRMLMNRKRENLVSNAIPSVALLAFFVPLTFFVYFPYVPLLFVLYLCLNFSTLMQFNFSQQSQNLRDWFRALESHSKTSLSLRGLFVLLLGICFVQFLLPPILVMSRFFIEMSNGSYGWTRSMDDYLGDGLLGNQFPQGLLICVFFTLAIVSVLPRKNRSDINLGLLYFGIFNSCVYVYYVMTNGISSYQTWKYFSFLFPLAFFFSVISILSLKASRIILKKPGFLYKSRFIVATFLLSFFVGKTSGLFAYPNPTQLTRESINAIESIEYLKNQNVGIAFNDTGTNMLVSGIVPSKSIAMLGPSYYGVITPNQIPKLDGVLTSMVFLSGRNSCENVRTVPVHNDIVFFEAGLENRRCIQSILE